MEWRGGMKRGREGKVGGKGRWEGREDEMGGKR